MRRDDIIVYINTIYRRVTDGVQAAVPGMPLIAFGGIALLVGLCFVMRFCVVGYVSEAELEELSAYPVIIQFIETNSAYLGLFFIVLGSVFLVGGLILRALDKLLRHVSHQASDLNDQIESIRSAMSSLSSAAKATPRRDTGTAPGIEAKSPPPPADSCVPMPVVQTKHRRIWPFGS